MHDFINHLLDLYNQILQSWGYPAIVVAMAAESTIVPLPSELIIPPVAHLAYTQGNMSLAGIVLAGTLGSWIGASIMYWLSRWAGRPLVLKYGPFFRIPPAKLERIENWAAAYGNFGIFAARLLPVVRHLIGIPAGIVRMNYGWFSLYTVIGSAFWCAVLCWLGIKAGQDDALMKGEMHAMLIWLVGILAVLGAIYYFFVHRQMRAKKA